MLRVLLLLPTLATAQQPLPREHPPRPTAPAITAADLMTRVYILADDSMAGRETGTAGNVRAATYIAGELGRLGLQPAGDSGTYFQSIPLRSYRVPDSARLELAGQDLRLWEDFAVYFAGFNQPERMRPLDGVEVIFGGLVGDSARMVWADRAEGRLVVLTIPRRPNGSPWFISLPSAFRLFQLRRAAGIALVELDYAPQGLMDYLRAPQALLALGDGVEIPTPLMLSRAATERIFGAPLDSIPLGAVAGTARARDLLAWQAVPAYNVIGLLPGSDPALRGQVVALGAHSDHDGILPRPVDHDSARAHNTELERRRLAGPARGMPPAAASPVRVNLDSLRRLRPARPDSIMNGADDDASGSAALLEIAEGAVRNPPARSQLFIWHTGEEKGLWGSAWHSEYPAVPRDSIVAYLNMDMVGRGGGGDIDGGGPDYLQLIGTRRLATELGDLIEAVNARSAPPMRLDYSFDADGHPYARYCRSDHAMYARFGIPVAQFSTGYHIDYHQPTDEPQYLDYPHLARVAQLVSGVARVVANLDHRLVVDRPKPDPIAPCRQ